MITEGFQTAVLKKALTHNYRLLQSSTPITNNINTETQLGSQWRVPDFFAIMLKNKLVED